MGDACYCKNKSTGNLEQVNLSQLQPQSQIGTQSELREPEIAQPQLQQPATENSIKDFASRLFNKGKSLMEKHINPQLAGKLEIVAKKIYQQSPEIIDRYEYQFNKPPSFRQLLSMVRDPQVRGMASDIMKTMMTNQKSPPNWGGKTKRARRKTPRSRRRRHRHRRTNKRK
jgi:hypothetical protein